MTRDKISNVVAYTLGAIIGIALGAVAVALAVGLAVRAWEWAL